MRIREAGEADAATLAELNVTVWRTTYRGIVPDAFLDLELDVAGQTRRWAQVLRAQPGSVLLLEADTAVVGFASGGPGRGGASATGELYTIYLLSAFQGRGGGRLLITAVVSRLRAQGFTSLQVWVLKDNVAARGFYEAMGGRLSGSQPLHLNNHVVDEVSYRWPDSLSLAQPWAANSDAAKSI